MTIINGVHCRIRWLTVTVYQVVTMKDMFLFRKQQSSKSVEGVLMIHNMKYTASSSSLLTRLGLTQTSSSRTFTAFIITLAMAIRCFLCKVLQRQGIVAVHSSQLCSPQHYSPEIREEAILSEIGYAGPCLASLGMSPCRHDCDFGQICACQHTAQKWLTQLHRLFSKTHEHHSVFLSDHMAHQYLSDCEAQTPSDLVVFTWCNDVCQVERTGALELIVHSDGIEQDVVS